MFRFIGPALLLLAAGARADEPKCSNGLPPLGSSRLQTIPAIEAPTEEALATWRDQLVERYESCTLAPFEPRAARSSDSGDAYAVDLERRVGKYRIRPDGGSVAARAIEIFGVELKGPAPKAEVVLTALKALHPWPVRRTGEVVADCHIELQRARRAELCLDLDDVDRREPSVVSTQLHAVVVCSAPLAADDVALVWLTPVAPAPLTPVVMKRAPDVAASFTAMLAPSEDTSRELACDDSRAWCAALTESGGLAISHGGTALPHLGTGEVEGFELTGTPSHWVGIEHLASGLRIARSTIGTFYGLPSVDQMRWWLSGGDCMLWHKRHDTPHAYPAPIELRSLCMIEGVWVEGTHAAVSVRGNVRHVAQQALIDDVVTRCAYTKEPAETTE